MLQHEIVLHLVFICLRNIFAHSFSDKIKRIKWPRSEATTYELAPQSLMTMAVVILYEVSDSVKTATEDSGKVHVLFLHFYLSITSIIKCIVIIPSLNRDLAANKFRLFPASGQP